MAQIKRYYGLYFTVPRSPLNNKIVGIFAEDMCKLVSDFLLNKMPASIGWDFLPISESIVSKDWFKTDSMSLVSQRIWLEYNKRRYDSKYKRKEI